jgi:hypothetical protein
MSCRTHDDSRTITQPLSSAKVSSAPVPPECNLTAESGSAAHAWLPGCRTCHVESHGSRLRTEQPRDLHGRRGSECAYLKSLCSFACGVDGGFGRQILNRQSGRRLVSTQHHGPQSGRPDGAGSFEHVHSGRSRHVGCVSPQQPFCPDERLEEPSVAPVERLRIPIRTNAVVCLWERGHREHLHVEPLLKVGVRVSTGSTALPLVVSAMSVFCLRRARKHQTLSNRLMIIIISIIIFIILLLSSTHRW